MWIWGSWCKASQRLESDAGLQRSDEAEETARIAKALKRLELLGHSRDEEVRQVEDQVRHGAHR